jgi:hypothetical protein
MAMLNEQKKPAKKKRKTRSDKGEIRATVRDLACILWIAEQYAARGDQIQRLLTRYPDPQHPFEDELASESTTREQINRWVRAGWIVYKRVLAVGPGWAYVTRAGLQLVDMHETFTARPPSPKRLNHIFAVNQVRIWMDEEQGHPWKSERSYRAGLNLKKGESSGPIPDALIWQNGKKTAVEVQLSPLKPHEWVDKLRELVDAYQEKAAGLGYEDSFPCVWFYVPSEEMKDAMEKARLKLKEDDQDRVSSVVEDDLLMEEEEDAWV